MEEKIGGKRYGEVRNFKKVRKFASSNLKLRSSKFKFTEILFCNPGKGKGKGEGRAEKNDGEKTDWESQLKSALSILGDD